MSPTTDLRPRNYEGIPQDISLVDDLADVLARTVVGWERVIGADLAQAPEVKRVLARYRAEKDSTVTVQGRTS
jgi:hypothetical protein